MDLAKIEKRLRCFIYRMLMRGVPPRSVQRKAAQEARRIMKRAIRRRRRESREFLRAVHAMGLEAVRVT